MGKQYSVIIPTMWRCPVYLRKMVQIYNSNSYINEIIIIDNNPSKKIDLSKFSKIKIITQEKNIFVNPAWNWGVKVSISDKIIIANDDIFVHNFDNLMSSINKFLKLNMAIGPSTECIKLNQYHFVDRFLNRLVKNKFLNSNTAVGPKNSLTESNGDKEIFFEKAAAKLTSGWGTMMWMYKESYTQIPKELKIFYGDSFQYHLKDAFTFNGILIETPMSHTIKTTNVSSILKRDQEIFLEKYVKSIKNKTFKDI